IEAAVESLVWAEGPFWALHLLGVGGVGKTMLVRYVASGRFASDRQRPVLPVARVDFDHLDPRYPEQRPAELLLALGGDLAGFAVARSADRSLRRLNDAVAVLHESLATGPTAAPQPQLLTQAIDAFVKFLNELQRPPLLVLDTCEELAKLHVPGVTAPTVERTFEILERIHAKLPSVRVLVAGRRWLDRKSVV